MQTAGADAKDYFFSVWIASTAAYNRFYAAMKNYVALYFSCKALGELNFEDIFGLYSSNQELTC